MRIVSPRPAPNSKYSVLCAQYRTPSPPLAPSPPRVVSPSLRLSIFLSLIFLSVIPGCAGYQVGQRSRYRPDIRTVYVPVVQSNSFRRYLGERLTEAIVKEIELKT